MQSTPIPNIYNHNYNIFLIRSVNPLGTMIFSFNEILRCIGIFSTWRVKLLFVLRRTAQTKTSACDLT